MSAANKPASPIRVYSFLLSGHAHRVRLFVSLLGLPSETVDVDLAAGAQHEPAFLALNPLGQVPVIDDGGTVIADSPSRRPTIGAKATTMIASLSATWLSVKFGSPLVRLLQTKTIAVHGAAARMMRPAM